MIKRRQDKRGVMYADPAQQDEQDRVLHDQTH